MPEVKGVLLNGWMQFLKSRFGDEEVNRGLELIDKADRSVLTAGFLDSSWYPFDTQRAISRLTRSIATSADQNLSIELGGFMAEYAFTRVYRSLLTNQPRKQVESAWIDEMLFRGVRRVESAMTGPSSCVLRYYYDQEVEPTAAICASTIGFCVREAELAGAGGVRVTHPNCAVRGADCCEVMMEWQADS
jgi:hypothetical protein